MVNKKGITPILTTIIFIVGGLIAWGIVSTLVTNTGTPGFTENESFTNTTAIPQTYRVGNRPYLLLSTQVTNSSGTVLTRDTNYTEVNTSYINITDCGDCSVVGDTFLITYNYQDADFFSSALSRTIMQWVVPLGIIGLLAVAAVGIRL